MHFTLHHTEKRATPPDAPYTPCGGSPSCWTRSDVSYVIVETEIDHFKLITQNIPVNYSIPSQQQLPPDLLPATEDRCGSYKSRLLLEL